MEKHTFHPPDEDAMHALLKEYAYEPTGIVLRLAWREGLTRGEISELTWDQVDFDAMLLRLPDREVPLEDEVATRLTQWKRRCEKFSPYVAVTDRLRKRLAPESMTAMVRAVLDRKDQHGVRLQDLRYDYIRRQLQSHDWPYVLRVAGVSIESYRSGLRFLQGHEPRPGERPAGTEDAPAENEELRFWRVLQAERATPAGIALWLSSQMALEGEELVRLIWDDVDFDVGVLRLPDRDVPLTSGARMVLADERARRGPGDDPHVLLTPRSRKPMDGKRLSVLARKALIRGGLEHRSMSDFRRKSETGADAKLLLDFAAEHGSISRAEAAELLDVTPGAAYRRLRRLVEQGALVRVNYRCYPPELAAPPERQRETVLRFVTEQGFARREEVAELLHTGKRYTSRLLRRMVEDGTLALLPDRRHYALPDSPGGYKNITT